MKQRFSVALINAWIKEQAKGTGGKAIRQLMPLDCVIIDELGNIQFSKFGGALLPHLISKLYEKTSVAITTNLEFGEWAKPHFWSARICKAQSHSEKFRRATAVVEHEIYFALRVVIFMGKQNVSEADCMRPS